MIEFFFFGMFFISFEGVLCEVNDWFFEMMGYIRDNNS